jgi:hypothetical protein
VQPSLPCESNMITYYECVSVALGIQHAMHMYHIVISGPASSSVFPLYLINGTTFEISY